MNWLLLILLLVVPVLPVRGRPIPDATPETFLGGPENLALIKSATSIKVFRVFNTLDALDDNDKPMPKKGITMDYCQCAPNPVNVTGKEFADVVAALQEMGNFGEALMCDFDPGVIIRFENNSHALDAAICFHCGEMVFWSDGTRLSRPFQWARSKNTFSRNAHQAFVALAKRAFPKDSEIQQIK